MCVSTYLFFFFFNDTATTEIYTLSLHDALPICLMRHHGFRILDMWESTSDRRLEFVYLLEWPDEAARDTAWRAFMGDRSEEHTSELQSLAYLVCRLLLEKKKN